MIIKLLNIKNPTVMKFLIVLAFIFAFLGIGFLIATLFTTGGSMELASIGAGLSLVAFILVFIGYVNKTNRN